MNFVSKTGMAKKKNVKYNGGRPTGSTLRAAHSEATITVVPALLLPQQPAPPIITTHCKAKNKILDKKATCHLYR
jgi:hypothetical protein